MRCTDDHGGSHVHNLLTIQPVHNKLGQKTHGNVAEQHESLVKSGFQLFFCLALVSRPQLHINILGNQLSRPAQWPSLLMRGSCQRQAGGWRGGGRGQGDGWGRSWHGKGAGRDIIAMQSEQGALGGRGEGVGGPGEGVEGKGAGDRHHCQAK